MAVLSSTNVFPAQTKFTPATNVTIDLTGALLNALFKSNTLPRSAPAARLTGNGGSLVLAGTRCINGMLSLTALAKGATLSLAGSVLRVPIRSLYHSPSCRGVMAKV
ncbi:hypothetical protein D3C81_817720 [compost metagenome]